MNCAPSFILGTLFLYARGLFIFPQNFFKKLTYPPGYIPHSSYPTPPHRIHIHTTIIKVFSNDPQEYY